MPPLVLVEADVAVTSAAEQEITAAELGLSKLLLVESVYNSTLGSAEIPINLGTAVRVRTETAIAQVETFTTPADVSDSLDGKTIILYDEDGSVGVWIDTDDSGTTIPAAASAADRALEVTTIVTDDTASSVATKIAAVINADSKFSASAVGAVVTVTHATAGQVNPIEASTSGITSITLVTEGADADESDPVGYLVGSTYRVRAIGKH